MAEVDSLSDNWRMLNGDSTNGLEMETIIGSFLCIKFAGDV